MTIEIKYSNSPRLIDQTRIFHFIVMNFRFLNHVERIIIIIRLFLFRILIFCIT